MMVNVCVSRSLKLILFVNLMVPERTSKRGLSAWWMIGPYTVMGVAEVYVTLGDHFKFNPHAIVKPEISHESVK